MKVIEINDGKDTLLSVPKPPSYLSNSAKKHYLQMGAILAKNSRLKELYLDALVVYSEAMAQYQFALQEIKDKNSEDFGSGFVQTFRTGAQNVSVYVTLKNDAQDTLFKCFKIFGLDPKSEKELKSTVDPDQTNLFEQFMNSKNG